MSRLASVGDPAMSYIPVPAIIPVVMIDELGIAFGHAGKALAVIQTVQIAHSATATASKISPCDCGHPQHKEDTKTNHSNEAAS